MIKVEVTYLLKPNQRECFYGAIVADGIDTAAKNEPGNLRYDFDIPEDEADVLYLHELWASDEALAAHAQMPHYQALGKLKQQYVLDTIIHKEIQDENTGV